MDHAALVLGGWAAAAVGLGGYTLWLLRRGRAVSREVPEGQRRWSDS